MQIQGTCVPRGPRHGRPRASGDPEGQDKLRKAVRLPHKLSCSLTRRLNHRGYRPFIAPTRARMLETACKSKVYASQEPPTWSICVLRRDTRATRATELDIRAAKCAIMLVLMSVEGSWEVPQGPKWVGNTHTCPTWGRGITHNPLEPPESQRCAKLRRGTQVPV